MKFKLLRVLTMKLLTLNLLTCLFAIASFSIGSTLSAIDFTSPIADEALVFEEIDGVLAIESEHFYRQSTKEFRAWYITSSKSSIELKPDPDLPHVAGASGGAYLEILPDTRANHTEKLIQGENFTDKPGLMAVLSYKVYINTPGRYYVWIRSYSTGSEDNGVHVGIDGEWPESGKRWQTVQKQKWAWECKQRTQEVHTGVPMQLFLDIEKAGDHELMISMREDGFEMDKIVLSRNKEFKPEGKGPAVQVKSGELPQPFPEVAESVTEAKPMDEGAAKNVTVPVLSLTAKDFLEDAQGYYLDKGKWLAINPEKNKQAKART
jgi:hypothetical protein